MGKQSQPMQALTSMNTGKWFTPPWYIEKVRKILGHIELDPASCAQANQHIVCAGRYFSEDEDGLSQEWKAKTIFLNPPYSKEGGRIPTAPVWARYALRQYELGNFYNGILLLNANFGYDWFSEVLDNPHTCVLVHRTRMRFIHPDGLTLAKSASKKAQASVFIGGSRLRDIFIYYMQDLGWEVGKP